MHNLGLCSRCEAPSEGAWLCVKCVKVNKDARYKREYGVSLSVLDNAFCEICGQDTDLAVDHNHTTQKFRGVLCRPCNRGIGFLHDDPELVTRAAEYLRQES